MGICLSLIRETRIIGVERYRPLSSAELFPGPRTCVEEYLELERDKGRAASTFGLICVALECVVDWW